MSLVSSSFPVADAINDEADGRGVQKGIILTLLSDRGAIIFDGFDNRKSEEAASSGYLLQARGYRVIFLICVCLDCKWLQ